MKMIADTNVLVRAVLNDDAVQSRASRLALSSAEQIVVSRHAFCEMVWVLRHSYKMPRAEIMKSVRGFLGAGNVVTDTAAVIDYEGRWLGGDTCVSFDKRAVAAIAKQGAQTKLLA
jgi:predicted nucleic-acid-binding protein